MRRGGGGTSNVMLRYSPRNRSLHQPRILRLTLAAALPLVASSAALAVVDVSLGEFFNLVAMGRIAPLNGFAVATVSCNVGTERVDWLAQMNPNHPMIAFSLYRLENNRLHQIGISWVKHSYFALDQSLCNNCTDPNGGSGTFLGVNCSDTYGVGDNSSQYSLGPRAEINPWTSDWAPCGSYFANAWGTPFDCSQSGAFPSLSAVDHLMIVADSEINPATHPTAAYYTEGVYIIRNDANRANNIGWRRIGIFGSPGSFSFANQNPDGSPMANNHAARVPQYGPALNLWGTDRVTLNAGQSPIAADGEVYAAMLSTDLGGGSWHYEYAVYNYNFDKQVHSVSIPAPSCATISNVTFRDSKYSVVLGAAPWAQDADGADWTFSAANDAATWTDSSGDNPIRWGQLYNFGFDCDRPPNPSALTIATAKPSAPPTISGSLPGPTMSFRKADVNGDAVVSIADVQPFIDILLTGAPSPAAACAADMNDSGDVNGDDVQLFADALY